MKLVRRLGTCALVTLIGSPLAIAQAEKSKPAPTAKAKKAAAADSGAPKPSSELKKVAYMAGDWTCTGKALASAMGPEHPVEAKVHVSWQLGKFWLLSQYREKKTSQNPMPISADEYWSHDAKAGWERVAVDSMGGWASGTGNWDGDKIVWMSEGPMAGQTTKFRDSFTKKSDAEITYVGEIAGADGNFARAWEIECRKEGR